ncbi:MAG: aldehyde dehydrogenase, partial [Solirubrobacteraceae bacterium]|nr:aldehyde dehydrogenase [Solirubrobacteraceae bacterium]
METAAPELPASVAEHAQQFYVDGAWVAPASDATLDVIDPSTEQSVATIALGTAEDVDRAVAAARAAFETFSQTTREERVELLNRIIEVYKSRMGDLATAVSMEMGAPVKLAQGAQVPAGLGHFLTTTKALKDASFEEQVGSTTIVYEPVGVCGFITPWNWPLNQIAAKVAPALAAGCTMVLKPSEIAPLNALIFAEILDEAGVPAGVFNLINGDGPTVGVALAEHPDIDMISFTGSTRAGIEVARNAAPTVKRVAQELGGKSANIVLDDADLAEVIKRDVRGVYVNSGQSCNATARILVPREKLAEAAEIARATA